MKVLIVDDEHGVLKMYSQYLQNDGIEVFQASNGEDGFKMAKEQKPDVILLDIIMPRYNGLDVLKDIKNDPEIKNIPVFLLTNLPQESSGEKAKQLGATGYLVKAEYEPKMILDAIKGAVAPKS
ncbi:MAG: Response regulator receiver protein [Berkelbacteria bacterium GW2011_GWB1_38_5]|uniref:Response regulator receiver protein n=1 Tax=Berkelbacteria bacterium GW2011_GWB1_38_5 TaxID=1618336 RepID=A0A0G0JXZ7_9BACT|nr:MAG: Response regulator receiver protein [Berkelbacteria bacterium GW2011_GWB1_38_5]